MSGFACMRISRSSKPTRNATESPSSRSLAMNLDFTRRAAVPYDVPSSTPGKAEASSRTVSKVTVSGRFLFIGSRPLRQEILSLSEETLQVLQKTANGRYDQKRQTVTAESLGVFSRQPTARR